MSGSIKVGGHTVFVHTGASGAGTLSVQGQNGNVLLSDDGTAVSLGNNVRLPASGGIKDSSGNNVLTESGGTVTFGNVIGGVPAGAIMSFAMSSAPSGWVVCNGAEYAIADYGDLHTAIGTTWGALTNGSGGAGSTHFRVPDLRGAFLRGTGTQTYSSVTYTGQSVGSFNNDTFKSHVHTIRMTHHGVNASQGYPDKQDTYDNGGVQYWDTESTGDSETRPFNAGINYCIKY